ncbi:hypothetical protein CCUG62472_04260 [Mycobacteroides salmoniphilum]|uniref:Uncharacterized protein n=1 Tax=Mycobacteroides salmoniphilum TaxID=404941 RepID=A0A4R8SPJ3_9MYCO|nr:hypothetical protein CCUG62472_04260 [Mycobacteroides salmoniphilum]TEA00952.1 hypothetical protein CCUG60884_04106 [Mycobacteroides salmoniphilum]
MRWFWDHCQALELVVLALAAPAVLYRGWRWWTDRPSLPLAAGAIFAVSIWPWALCDIEPIWRRLPPQIQAFHAAGGIGVLASASAWVLVVEACGMADHVSRRKKIRRLVVGAAVTLATIAALTSSVVSTPGGGDFFTYLTEPRRDSLGLFAATLIGHIFAAGVLAHLALLTVRRMDRTPAGRGLRLLGAAGGAVAMAVITRGVCAELFQWHGYRPPPWCGLTVQTSAITAGAVLAISALTWPPLALRHQARRTLRQLRPLRDGLIELFPGLAPPQPFGTRLTDLVPEWIGQIQDGLSLMAQCRNLPLENAAPPQDRMKHVQAAVDWIGGQSPLGMSVSWLQAPPPLTNAEWIRVLANAFHLGRSTPA